MSNSKFINSSANGIVVSEPARPPAAVPGTVATDEVKIKLKHGQWEVEITCAEGKVRQVVETVLSSLDSARLGDPALRAQLEELRREVDALKSRPIASVEGRPTAAAIANGEQKLGAKSGSGGMTCRGLIETLWLEGYFGAERSLGDVHEELSRRGYNYDRTAVSHSLTDMVRETILTRVGTMRNYRYIQKRPPGDLKTTAAG